MLNSHFRNIHDVIHCDKGGAAIYIQNWRLYVDDVFALEVKRNSKFPQISLH